MVDSLAIAVISFRCHQNMLLRYEVEVTREFARSTIDQEEEVDQEATPWKDAVAGPKILQLKGNTIPCGLVPLERLFNKDDIATKQRAPEMDDQVQYYNIGSEEEPQMIKFSKESPCITNRGI